MTLSNVVRCSHLVPSFIFPPYDRHQLTAIILAYFLNFVNRNLSLKKDFFAQKFSDGCHFKGDAHFFVDHAPYFCSRSACAKMMGTRFIIGCRPKVPVIQAISLKACTSSTRAYFAYTNTGTGCQL